MKTIAHNRRAEHKYAILEVFHGGLVLTGTEIKSIRAGQVNLEDGFARIDNGEIFLWNTHIAPYKQGAAHIAQDPTRKRKLLLSKAEINRIYGKMTVKGFSLVPLEIYISDSGYAKVKLALAKGKTAPDRRADLKKKDLAKELRREFSGKHKL